MNKLFVSFFVILFSLLIQGCKQDMDLNPQDYFSGQQLVLAEDIQRGDIDGVEKLAPQTELNKPGKQDMTLLFWALGNSINDN